MSCEPCSRCRRISRHTSVWPPGRVGRAMSATRTCGPPGRNVRSAGCVLRRPDDRRCSIPDAVAARGAIVLPGRRPGEHLAMPDNGFGTKANSFDFLLRAYYIRPELAEGWDRSRRRRSRQLRPVQGPERRHRLPIQRPIASSTEDRPRSESLQRGKNSRPAGCGRGVRPLDPSFRQQGTARTTAAGPGRPRRLHERHGLLGVSEQPVQHVGGASDRGREPGLRIGGGDARRRVPVRASQGHDVRTRTRTADTCWSSAPTTWPSRGGSGSTARNRRSPARSSAASWLTCGPSTSTGWW